MGTVQTFLQQFDLSSLFYYLSAAVASLLCIVIHEMSHGYAAYLLGDRTAKNAGRLSFNPIHHIDPFGLLLMIIAGFGWAKPVPVDMRNFKNPKRGMALTALAGPTSNFVLALVVLGLASLLYNAAYGLMAATEAGYWLWENAIIFLLRVGILSVGLGVFNLIPIPPLDGAKVVFSLLPNRIYYQILRYEKYVMLALFALVWLGVLDTPLYAARKAVLRVFCHMVGLPEGLVV